MRKTTYQALQGAVLGQAIGDAMGSQTEFHKGYKVSNLGPTWGYNDPAFSDDTQNFLAIAEALITTKPPVFTRGHLIATDLEYLEPFMQEMGENFIRWIAGDPRWGDNDRSPGGTCMGGTRALKLRGTDQWRETGARNSGKGNGGAMRAASVGCYYWQNPVMAFQVGALTSVPTHANLESMMAAGGVAFLVARAIAGRAFADSIFLLLDCMDNWQELMIFKPECTDQRVEFAIARVGQAFAAAMAGKTVADFKRFNGHDGKGVEALAAAIHGNLIHNSYSATIISLANDTGDSDSTAAIGGAIAGARFGIDNIPSDWQHSIEKSDYLFDVAERLFAASEQPETATASPVDTSAAQPAH